MLVVRIEISKIVWFCEMVKRPTSSIFVCVGSVSARSCEVAFQGAAAMSQLTFSWVS